MANEGMMNQVRALRAEGCSPKQVARALGLPRSVAAELIRKVDAGGRVNTAHPDIVGCWVSPGWSHGLTVEGHSEWPEVSDPDFGTSGLVAIMVVRDDRCGGKVSVCGYLVDVYFLGVKNALGPRTMTRRAEVEFRSHFFGAYPSPPLAAPIELAQNLVFGAIEYARGLGFEPHEDFPAAAGHLGSWTGPSPIGFGCDGKPLYIQGPHDDMAAISSALQRSAA